MMLEHVSKAYAEYCLVEIAYTLVFDFEVHHQFIGDIKFRTSTKVEAEFVVCDFCTIIPKIDGPSCIGKSGQRIKADVVCQRKQIVNICIQGPKAEREDASWK